jgi:phage I-like protein
MFRIAAIALLLLSSRVALGQDGPNPEQLKRMYNDALVQLRSAQDRKNELANENEALRSKLAEMTKAIETNHAQIEQLKANWAKLVERDNARHARTTMWKNFVDRDWPLSAVDQRGASAPTSGAANPGATSGI